MAKAKPVEKSTYLVKIDPELHETLRALAKAYNLPGQRELLTVFVSLVAPEIKQKAEEILRLEKQISSLKTE